MEIEKKNNYGLLGKGISYSFSEKYFNEKFENEGLLDCQYSNFDLENLLSLKKIISANKNLKGMNVTTPYKETVIPFLTHLDPTASAIGAINTIKIVPSGLLGYNTDAIGFKNSLIPLLKKTHRSALILGTGGASKAVAYVLKELEISFQYVSRNPKIKQLAYSELNAKIMGNHQIIINCTPIGTFPNILEKPKIPYEFINKKYIAFDLIYNPEISAFLMEAKKKGAKIQNGYEMLKGQAEASWAIWRDPTKI